MTLLAMSEAIARGAVSSVEVVAKSLAARERTHAVLNAFISVDRDAALEAARAADIAMARGQQPGPLHGIPIAFKDMFDKVGHRCTFGSRLRQALAPRQNAAVLQNLEDSGAVLIGALNMSEFALGPTGHNATFGHCRNPLNPERIAGGSSSGAGAAVAATIVEGAVGSDTGGSIRIPAACCGVTGLKPTQGRINARGAMPLARSLDCIGPLAATVSDCEVLFYALCGKTFSPVKPEWIPAKRIVFPEKLLGDELSREILHAVKAAAQVFEPLGVELVDRDPGDIAYLHDLADTVQKPESAAAHYATLSQYRHVYTPHVRRRIEAGFLIAAPAYIRAREQRKSHLRFFTEETLHDADALLLPTLGFATPLIEETDELKTGAQLNLVPRMTRWTRWINYLGVPALSVPCGRDEHGMPIGIQLIARPNQEQRLFALGRMLESSPTTQHQGAPMHERPRGARCA